MVAIDEKIGSIKVILLRQRWKSVDIPKAIDFMLMQMFTGRNTGDSVLYYKGAERSKFDMLEMHVWRTYEPLCS